MGVSLAEIAVGLLSTFHGSNREASLGLIAATDDKPVHGAEPSTPIPHKQSCGAVFSEASRQRCLSAAFDTGP